MKKLILLLLLAPLLSVAQSDRASLADTISANFPDNTSGFITPQRLRNVALELMRSNANLQEANVFSEPQEFEDSVKTLDNFYTWNGSAWEAVSDPSDTTVWSRSGGFILPLEYSDKLRVDTAQFDGLLYPNGNVNIGQIGVPFDTIYSDVVSIVAMRFVDGNESNGYVLTSDANGDASWGLLGLNEAYDNSNGLLEIDNGTPLTVQSQSNIVLTGTGTSTDTIIGNSYPSAIIINSTKNTISLGSVSTDLEWLNYKRGFESMIFGANLYAPSFGEVSTGMWNTNYAPSGGDSGWNSSDRIFSIGNGQNSGSRSNAVTVLKNGNVGIGTETPSSDLDVEGGFQYVDGSQATGAKLISDASGNASWELPSFGEMGFGDSSSTIALTQNTPAWVTNPNNDLWSLGAIDFSNGVSYSGDSLLIETAGIYQVNIQLSMSGPTSSVIELQLFKNGSQDCTCSSVLSLHNNEKFSLSYTDITDLSDGDILRVFVENTADNNDVAVINGKITLHRLK